MLSSIKKTGALALVATFASLLTLYASSFFAGEKKIIYESRSSQPHIRQVDRPSGGSGAKYIDFSDVAQRVTPAVVHIRSIMNDGGTAVFRSSPDQFANPFDLFGRGFPQFDRVPQPSVSSGSGVVINDEGYIVTNHHVVEGADELEVTLHDKRVFKAKVIGKDPSTDLALIKIEADQLSTMVFGNSDDVRVGEWVLAVGNPFNLASTVTAGIVSAKARNINILKGNAAIESFIQTDAAVNPGNSGGALVNDSGELIGINTAIASRTGSFAGYAFAVPSNIATKVIEDLMKHGIVQRAYIGINIREVNGKLKEEYDLSRNTGVYVEGLADHGAAKEAGLAEGDIIISIDGRAVNTVPELQEIIGRRRPGDVVKVGFDRYGKIKEVDMSLRNRAGNTAVVEKSSKTLEALGVSLKELSDSEASKYGVEHGVQIEQISRGQFTQMNIRPGFIVTQVNGKKVKTIEEFENAMMLNDRTVELRGTYPNDRGMYYYSFSLK